MKKIKISVSLCLAAMLMILSIVPAFAELRENYNNICELEIYGDQRGAELNLYVKDFCDPVTGDAFLKYWNSEVLVRALENTRDFCNDYYLGRDVTLEEIQEQYRLIDEAYDSLEMDGNCLIFLINFCEQENNDNGYYTEDEWTKYTNCISQAKSNIGTARERFWTLYHAYSDLCLANTLPGDTDRDGTVTVIDATIIQQYVAEIITLNSSQMYICSVANRKNEPPHAYPFITDVTEIQKYLAQMADNTKWNKVCNWLSENFYATDIRVGNTLFYSAYHKHEYPEIYH